MAAKTVETLVVRLLGDASEYVKVLDGAVKQTEKIGQKMQSMGRTMALHVTAPITAMAVGAVKSFADFDKAMTESTSIMENLSDTTIQRMREVALELSTKSIQGPAKLAEAYFFLGSSGLNAEQAMAALPVVAQFATAGAFDLAEATDLLVGAQSALGLTSKDAAQNMQNMTRLGDLLAQSNILAQGEIEDFATALTTEAGSAMKNFNIRLEDGLATLAAYASQNIKAELAGHSYGRVLRLLAQSTMTSAKAHEELGFRVFDAAGEFRPMADILQNLEEIMAGMGPEQKTATLATLGFQARIQQAILPLIGMSDAVRQYKSELEAAGPVMQQISEKQMAAFSNQMIVLKNQLQVVGIEIGERLAPFLIALSEKIRILLGWWKTLSTDSQNFILIAAGVAAAIGPLLIALGITLTSVSAIVGAVTGLAGSLMMLLNPVFLVIAGVTALTAWIVHATGAVEFFKAKWDEFAKFIQPAIDGIVAAIKAGDIPLAFEIMLAQIDVIWQTATIGFRETWINFTGFLSEVFIAASGQIQTAMVNLVSMLSETAIGALQFFKQISDAEAQAMQMAVGVATGLSTKQVQGRTTAALEESQRITQDRLKAAREGVNAAQERLNTLNAEAAAAVLQQQIEKFGGDVLLPFFSDIGGKIASIFGGGSAAQTAIEGAGGSGLTGAIDRSFGRVEATQASGLAMVERLQQQTSLFGGGTQADPKKDTMNLQDIKEAIGSPEGGTLIGIMNQIRDKLDISAAGLLS